MKGYITNIKNHQYFNTCTIVYMSTDEMIDISIWDKYEGCIPTSTLLICLLFNTNGDLVASNQNDINHRYLQNNLKELKHLNWDKFQMTLILNQYGIYVPIFQLIKN